MVAGIWVSIGGSGCIYSSVVGITAVATLRQVQMHNSAKVVKHLCVARLK